MASGGHNAKSVLSLKKEGTFRPDRHSGRIETASKPLESIPEPPKEFDKRHREKWQEVCKRVFDLGILTENDLDMIALYVRSWFMNIDAWASVQKDGIIVTTSRGQTKNPAMNIMRETSVTIISISNLFGFSPQARMRIRTEPTKKDTDPLAAFLNN